MAANHQQQQRAAHPPRWILPPPPPVARTNDAGRPYPNEIGLYSLGRIIGKGGFGVVYQSVSKHEDTYGEEVAIKALEKRLMLDPRMQQRVRNEVEIHWQLDHPSILRLITYFEDETHVYLVMELCANGELFQYIQRRGSPLSEAEGRTATYQIVSGLMYLHSCGVMHRDLKLSNLLLTKKLQIKIADFGLAARLAHSAAEQKTMCGTPNYISPEIVSRQPYGLTSDVWSLGCMLVTILTGQPPFNSNGVKHTLEKVSRVEYHLPDHLSDQAKDLIRRLLIKDPKSRLPLEQILSHPWFALPKLNLKPLVSAKPLPSSHPGTVEATDSTNQDKAWHC
ncbi:kinase-like domain-containing protein [Zopfochytrium polystomum]|nr:kinase-like domain-containing protein [Zopfochytrium polystomum]